MGTILSTSRPTCASTVRRSLRPLVLSLLLVPVLASMNAASAQEEHRLSIDQVIVSEDSKQITALVSVLDSAGQPLLGLTAFNAAIDGMIVREKPATMFYMGAFFAESLILAETGNSVGAIQIAGTAQPAQLPFFVAACDYTLIGEELFAASAYLSREPRQLGSLKGQDIGKGLFILCIIVGVILATLNVWDMSVIFASR